MRITRDMTIVGVPAVKLRDTFKRLGSIWSEKDLATLLGEEVDGHRLTLDLLAEGYVEPAEGFGGKLFTTTIKGCALALATAAKPIRRATAERLVREVLERAEAVNADGRYLYGVGKILAFGSYLTDCPTLGDVDLAVELKSRHPDQDTLPEKLLSYSKAAEVGGRQFASFFDRLSWPTDEIYRLLKGSSTAISLHTTDDHVLLTANPRVIYEQV
jgi:hypothetical protein